MNIFSKFCRQSSAGDTIIEVIIGIAILGTVLAATYVSTTHSLQLGTDSGNRSRAIGFAQQQLEQIKYIDQQGNIAPYSVNGQPFCVDPSTGSKITIAAPDTRCGICTNNTGIPQTYLNSLNSSNCPAGTNLIFSVGVVFSSAANVFTVDSQWGASNGAGADELTMYYKLPG